MRQRGGSAFWEKNDTEQVTTEVWDIGGKQFRAYIGNLGTRGSEETISEIPEGLYESIVTTIKNERLNGKCHWIRHFFGNANGDHMFEALLDNEIWEAGLQNLKHLQWKKSDEYYSVRNFIVLRATE